MGKLAKLKIRSYDKIAQSSGKVLTFEAMFNPETYTESKKINYSKRESVGTGAGKQSFNSIEPQEHTFDLLFDGTGVAESSGWAFPFGAPKPTNVKKEIDNFFKITSTIDGDIHSPRYLLITWGEDFTFQCVLTKATVKYTLFKPDGTALRAKISATFRENIDEEKRAKIENKNSRDLTHIRVVQEGDTLPLMTYRIYGDDKYLSEVARVNNIVNIRKLKVGQKIFFPPLSN